MHWDMNPMLLEVLNRTYHTSTTLRCCVRYALDQNLSAHLQLQIALWEKPIGYHSLCWRVLIPQVLPLQGSPDGTSITALSVWGEGDSLHSTGGERGRGEGEKKRKRYEVV